MAALNNYGFCGTNGHALLQSNQKNKCNDGVPDDDLPRLVLISGRTTEAVDVILKDVRYARLFLKGSLILKKKKNNELCLLVGKPTIGCRICRPLS